jgi:hypothetical protein
MKNKNIIIIIILILIGILVGFYFLNKTKPADIVLNADVYPLYSSVTWNKVVPATEEDLAGFEVSTNAANDISNIAEISTPFEKYYADKLESLGWSIDNSRAAGGPGADITAYKKGDEYIIIRFDTNFKGTQPNALVQCPCDVTFYVFSGKIK